MPLGLEEGSPLEFNPTKFGQIFQEAWHEQRLKRHKQQITTLNGRIESVKIDSRETRFEVVILWKNFDWEFVMMSPRIWRSF